ncbi:MAG: hypothetical protein KDD61_16150 [Bdellovibrionales bacterium]|nr:hypothetical protein [Bdellovibrionales bacterium]
MEVCPNCGNTSLVRDLHLGGQLRCSECQWVGSQVPSVDLPAATISAIRWGGLLTLVGVFLFFCMQLFVWGQYSFDATLLIVKQYSGVAQEEDYLELGSICNAIDNHECAIRYFGKVLDMNPRHKTALANLGINYALDEKWDLAKSHFEGYFSMGGNGYDVLLWYGRVLDQIEGDGASIEWSYLALASKPTYQEAAIDLIEKLSRVGKKIEALSIIGGMAEGHPQQGSVWSDLFQNMSQEIIDKGWPSSHEKESFLLAKVKGRHFYIPVALKEHHSLKLFAIDRAVKHLWMDEDFVFANQIQIPVDAPTHSLEWGGQQFVGREVKLEQLYIGPWTFKGLKVMACGQCPFIFGEEPLQLIDYKLWSRHQTEFLTVHHKKH